MQVLDHAAVDRHNALAFGLRLPERRHDLLGGRELGHRGREDLVARLDLAGMDQRLADEAHLGALPAHGAEALDGVYNDIQDLEGFRAACQQGVEMGFDGKTLIHPGQVEPCNEIFAPSAAELEMAGKIVVAFKSAQAEGKGVVTVDGRMIENLHVEQAERALALAAAIRELQAA